MTTDSAAPERVCASCEKRSVSASDFRFCVFCLARKEAEEHVELREKWLSDARGARSALFQVVRVLDASDVVPEAVSVSLGDSIAVRPLDHRQALGIAGLLGKFARPAHRWEREPDWDGETLRFRATAVMEVDCGIWKGWIEISRVPLPPSCRVEWTEVEMPARRVRKPKIVCMPEEAAP